MQAFRARLTAGSSVGEYGESNSPKGQRVSKRFRDLCLVPCCRLLWVQRRPDAFFQLGQDGIGMRGKFFSKPGPGWRQAIKRSKCVAEHGLAVQATRLIQGPKCLRKIS